MWFKQILDNVQNHRKRKTLSVSGTSSSKPYSVELCVHLEATSFGPDIDNHQAKNTQLQSNIYNVHF